MGNAAQDLQDKLKLEAQLRPEIEAYNRTIVRNFMREMGAHGTTSDFSKYDAALIAILLAHYLRTSKKFDSKIRGKLPKDVAITKQEAEKISAALSSFFPPLAEDHARGINRTTQSDAADAVDAAQQEQVTAAQQGSPLSKPEIAAIAGAVLHRRLRGRLIATVMSETQAAAETAKATEAEVLSGVSPSVSGGSPQPSPVMKEWETVGDNKVRDDHVAADGQQVTVDEPFIVGGEQLRWPGDGGLGASPGNIINCRCSAGYDEQGIIENRKAQEQAS